MTESNEVDYKILLRLIKSFFNTKKFIISSIIVFFIIGLLYVFITPNTYSSRIVFITQDSQEAPSGGLKGIASLLNGGNKSSGTNDIPTFLYPQIINSWKFRKQLFDIPLKLKNEDSLVSLKKFILEKEKLSTGQIIAKYTLGLPRLLFKKKQLTPTEFKIDSLDYVTADDNRILQSLQNKLSFSINDEDGTLEIKTFIDNQPEAAALLAKGVQQRLQNEIVHYRIAKAKEKYEFIEKQSLETKLKYTEAQQRLATYSDKNLFNSTQSSLIYRQRLENEVTLLFGMYIELEQQRITQSIKIKEDTPNFTIITPARVPLGSENKSTIIILAMSVLMGFIVSFLRFIYIESKQYVAKLWQEV